MHSERREQREVMIDRVDEPDLRRNEFVVAQLPQRLAPDGVIGDPLSARPRAGSEKPSDRCAKNRGNNQIAPWRRANHAVASEIRPRATKV